MLGRAIQFGCLIITCIVSLKCGIASAQPALERVEQSLRRPSSARPTSDESASQPSGYLGVVVDERTDKKPGVRVLEVAPQGPAEQAGLRMDDLILSINNQPVVKLNDMARLLKDQPVGARVAFQIQRGDVAQQIRVTLGERGARATTGPRLGVRTIPVSPEVQQQFELPDTRGAVVTAVVAGSPAEKAGVPVGVVLTAIDDQALESPAALATIIGQSSWGDTLDVTYMSKRGPVMARVTLERSAPGPAESQDADRPVAVAQSSAAQSPVARSSTARKPVVQQSVAAKPPVVVQPPGFVPEGTSPDPTVTRRAAANPPDLAQRVKTLERRIAELEERIKQLEAAR